MAQDDRRTVAEWVRMRIEDVVAGDGHERAA